MSVNWEALAKAQQEVEAKGWRCVTGAAIVSPEGKIFVQKRSDEKALFPGGWDVAGGHVEPGETLQESLRREILEETGWRLTEVVELIQQVDWSVERGEVLQYRREFDFLVRVEGDLANPQIEAEKFTEWRWIDTSELELLKENRGPEDTFTFDMVEKAFALVNSR